jgi:hypothetical protein
MLTYSNAAVSLAGRQFYCLSVAAVSGWSGYGVSICAVGMKISMFEYT